ncbi:amidohydrolase family protein [Candidatus Thioglobus sp.]|nr:amidohydrolase family protein [Candidatus Thioglobus sp.]
MHKKYIGNLLVNLLIVVGVIFSSAILAKNPNMAVQKQDSNGDGKISLSEWSKPSAIFKKIDFNNDGFIVAEEFAKKWGIPMPGGPSNERSIDEAGSIDMSTTIIADVHMHPMSQHPIDQLTWMNRNGVKWAGLGAMQSFKVENYRRVLGERYIPFGGQGNMQRIYSKYGSDGVEDENNPMFELMIEELRADFSDGNIKGVGEIFGNNRTTNPKPNMRRKSRIDAPTYRALLDLVAQYGGAMSMHVQWDQDSIGQLEVLADHNPNGNIIWAHCGNDGSAQDVRKVLKSHVNIYCDLSARSRPKLSDWVVNKRPQAEIFTSHNLNASWKELIEEMPGRFMVGTDTKGGSNYDRGIENIRSGLLANLTKETAEKVAYKNAQKLLNLH